jgi:hypothetical protein
LEGTAVPSVIPYLEEESNVHIKSYAQRFEEYLVSCSKEVVAKLVTMTENSATHEELSQYLVGYYECISPEMMTLDQITKEHLESILTDGIVLLVPTGLSYSEVNEVVMKLNVYGVGIPPTAECSSQPLVWDR